MATDSCKICGVIFGDGKCPYVDLCQETFFVRGFLCHDCLNLVGNYSHTGRLGVSDQEYLLDKVQNYLYEAEGRIIEKCNKCL